LHLLTEFYTRIVIPLAVVEEWERGKAMGVKLGVLLRAKAEGRITRLEPVLADLDRLGFRLSAQTRAGALKLAGE